MESLFGVLNGQIEVYPSCNTLQVDDYNKYEMEMFNEEDKIDSNQTQFPLDLKEAYNIVAKLINKS